MKNICLLLILACVSARVQAPNEDKNAVNDDVKRLSARIVAADEDQTPVKEDNKRLSKEGKGGDDNGKEEKNDEEEKSKDMAKLPMPEEKCEQEFMDSNFYKCIDILKSQDQSQDLYTICLCMQSPNDKACDVCEKNFSHPKCCERVLDENDVNHLKFKQCCQTFAFHTSCSRNRFRKKSHKKQSKKEKKNERKKNIKK